MKKLVWSVLCALICFACAQSEETKTDTADTPKEEMKEEKAAEEASKTEFGVAVDGASAMQLTSMIEKVGEADSMLDLTVKGKVKEVCQMKGCWMTLEKEDGSTIRVTFKDYKLFMPKDLAGSEVALHGKAMKKEMSVDALKHYAEDAGKSEEEIAKITEPEMTLAFEADGVKVMK